MLRFATVGNPIAYFTQHLDKGDYFLEGQEEGGIWQGKGADLLSLDGEVTAEAFAKLCQNRVPGTNEKLTPRDSDKRRPGVDLSFHCPKSVSVLYGLSGDEAIKESVQEAVRKTMQEMEREVQVRVRKGKEKNSRENRTTGNLIWGEFVHKTARPVNGVPDPHLHVHCYVFNASYDKEEQRFKAAELGNIRRDAKYYQALFHNHLAHELTRQGYAIEASKKGWEIAGIKRETLEKFSSRTKEVEEKAREKEEKLGRKLTDKERDGLAAETRSKKAKDIPYSQLREKWGDRLSLVERDQILAIYNGRDPEHYQTQEAERTEAGEGAIAHAFSHCLERKSVVSEKELLTEALTHSIGRGSFADVQRGLDLHESVLRGKDSRGERMVTTMEVKAEEEAMLAFARKGKGSLGILNDNEDYEFQYDFLNTEQRAAVHHVISTKDRVAIIQGKAGVGKTTTIKEAAHAIEQGGKSVYTFAPTSDATEILQQDGFDQAATVSRLLVDERLQEEIKGQVIWIDEAGLVSGKMMGQVFAIAESQNARVILSGDTKQHHSVERGDAMRQLAEQARLPIVSIDKIQRQKGQYREAVEAASEEEVGKSFEILDGLKWVEEVKKEAERGEKLAKGYVDTITQGKTALVVSPTHKEKDQVTKEIREKLKAKEIIKGEESQVVRQINLNWTEAERKDERNYEKDLVIQMTQNAPGLKRGERLTIIEGENGLQAQKQGGQSIPLPLEHAKRFQVYRRKKIDLAKGDQIAITQNGLAYDKEGKKKKLINGMIYQVDKINGKGIHLKNGWIVGKEFGHIDHGYCTTSHKAQGKTVDHVFLAQSSESNAAASREQFYVSISRGRRSVMIYTDDKAELKRSVYRSGERLTAIEMEQKQKTRETKELFQDNVSLTTDARREGKESFDRDNQQKQEEAIEKVLNRDDERLTRDEGKKPLIPVSKSLPSGERLSQSQRRRKKRSIRSLAGVMSQVMSLDEKEREELRQEVKEKVRKDHVQYRRQKNLTRRRDGGRERGRGYD